MIRTILFTFCVLFLFQVYGQETERDANYHFKSENYPVALDLYKDLYKKDTVNIELNYRLGVCYLNCNSNPKAALKHLIYVEGKHADDGVYYHELGKAYLYNYQFSYATDAFIKSKQLSLKNPEFEKLNDVWMSMTENAKRYTRKPMDVSFVNLGKYINSKMDEFTPVTSADGEFLLFTSNRKFDRSINLYTYDVYYSQITDEAFKKGKALTSVNTIDDEYLAGISANGDAVFVQLQGYEAFEDLVMVPRTARGFGKSEAILGEVNSKSAEYGATLSITGDTMYFSSAREGGSGGMDIYYSRSLPNGAWGIPTNMGNKINSSYNEDFPMMSPDGKTLYFCSDNDKSMGGYDVFKSTLLANGEFTEPQNLGFPLNDVFDNKTIAYSSNQRYAYVSAIRSDGLGYSDLYRVIFNQEDPSVKILILNIKTGTKEQSEAFGVTDTTLTVTAFQKGKVVIGKYAYDSKNSQSTIALPPGNYTLEVSGTNTETTSFKINVPDVPGKDKIVKKTVFLKPKQ